MIQSFSGTLQEAHALERICGVWDFWSYHQLQATFKTYPYQIYYSYNADCEAFYFESIAIFLLGEACELLYVYTLPSARGKGLGKEVMLFALKNLPHLLEAKEILLEVRPSNSTAIALYQACGYLPFGRRARYYADGEDAILMKFSWAGA